MTHPCIDSVLGPTSSNFYWSSTTRVTGEPYAWSMSFYDGYVAPFIKDSDILPTRAVRGGF